MDNIGKYIRSKLDNFKQSVNDNQGFVRYNPQTNRRMVDFGASNNQTLRSAGNTFLTSTSFIPTREVLQIATNPKPLLSKSNIQPFTSAAKKSAILAGTQALAPLAAPVLSKIPVFGSGLAAVAQNPIGRGVKNMFNPTFAAANTGLGAGIGYLTGQDPKQAAAEALGRAPGLAFGLGITSPVLQSAGTTINALKNPLVRQAVGRGVSGAANVAEGLVLDKLTGLETTPTSIAIDAGAGLLMPGNVGLKGNKTLVREKLHEAAVLRARTLQRELGVNTQGTVLKIKDITPNDLDIKNTLKRQVAKAEKRIKAGDYEPLIVDQNGVLLDGHHKYQAAKNLGIKEYPVVIQGTKPSFAPQQQLLRPNGGQSLQSGEIDSKLAIDMGGAGVGSLAGFEKDENGKWRYNPVKGATGAALGFGARRGVNAVKSGISALENKAYDSVLAKDLSGEGLFGGVNKRVRMERIINKLQPEVKQQSMSDAAEEVARRINGTNNLELDSRSFDARQKVSLQNEARMAREFGYTPIDDIVRRKALQSGEIDFSAKIGGKNVDPLVQEARKYKSAEELLKVGGKAKNLEDISYITPNGEFVGSGGVLRHDKLAKALGKTKDDILNEGNIRTVFTKVQVPGSKNILGQTIKGGKSENLFIEIRGNATPQQLKVIQEKFSKYPLTVDITDKAGKVIKSADIKGSQLTDIWNKANAGGNIDPKAQAPQVGNQAVSQSQSKVALKVGRKLPAQQSLQVPGSSSPNITPKRTTIQDIERQIYGSETGVTAQGSKKSVGIIADNLRKIEKGASDLVSRGLESENNIIRNVAGLMQDLAGGAGKSTGQVEARAQYRGGVDYATKVASDAQKHIYTLLGNNEKSLARVHAVLDPQISKIKVSEQNLTPPEREALGTLRILSDFVNDTNYKNGFISKNQWVSNRGGKYIARAYEVFDYPPEVADFIKNKDMRFDLNPFKTRKEITDWKVENAITDPAYLMGKRIQQTMFNGEVKKYTEWARKSGLTSDIERPGFVQLSDSKAYGEMAGKWIRKDALEDVKGFFVTHDVGQKAYEILNWYDRNPIRRTQKMLKTVFNPAVRLGNRTGNYVFAWLNGINPVSFAKNTNWANGAIKRNDPLYRFAMQNGLIGTDVTKADIARVSAELSREIKEPGLLKATIQELQNSYGRVDDASKLASLKTWIDRGVDPTEAINRTRRGFQDYNMVGFLYDIGAKLPILGNPFVRFSSESMRIAKNAAIDHPLRSVGTIGAWALFTDVMSRMQGETPQDRETREQRIGASHLPFTNISTNIQTPWGEANVSRLLGFSTTFTPDGATYTDVSKYAPIQNPLDVRNYGSDPMVGPIISLGTDTDFRGKSIADPNQSKYVGSTLTQSEKNMNRAGYLARSYLPPTATDLYNVGAAAQGKPNVYGQVKSVPQAVARVYPGVKVEQYGTEEAEAARKREAYFNTQKMERLETKAKAIQNDLETGKITEDQAKKRNTEIIKEMIPDPKYIDDKDAPKGIIDKLKLYIKAGGTDLPATLYALRTDQPIRKVENDIVVLKRMQDLGKLDFGDTSTQVDHDVPLQYGGSNYDNTLPIADNKQKTIAQKKLYKQYEQGKITKTELINGIDNWKEVPLTTTEKKTAAALPNGKYYEYKDDKGTNRKIVIEKVELPKMTGNAMLDKKLLSTYTQQLTTNANNVVKLYKLGKLSAQEAEKMLTEFESQSSKTKSLKTSKKAKKPKKLKLPKIKKPKKLRLKKIKLKTITVKTPKLKKFKEPKFVNLSKLKA